MSRFHTLACLDKLKIIEGRLAESRAKAKLLESRLNDPDLSTEEVLRISSSLEIIETDMVGCLHDILCLEQEVSQILC